MAYLPRASQPNQPMFLRELVTRDSPFPGFSCLLPTHSRSLAFVRWASRPRLDPFRPSKPKRSLGPPEPQRVVPRRHVRVYTAAGAYCLLSITGDPSCERCGARKTAFCAYSEYSCASSTLVPPLILYVKRGFLLKTPRNPCRFSFMGRKTLVKYS